MSDDPQDRAEALDGEMVDVVDVTEDLRGDDVGEGLPDYPPDRPLGVDTVGVTAVEEDAGESFAERTAREMPDVDEVPSEDDPATHVGQLVDPHTMSEDHEAQVVADALPPSAAGDGPEAAAMHIEET